MAPSICIRTMEALHGLYPTVVEHAATVLPDGVELPDWVFRGAFVNESSGLVVASWVPPHVAEALDRGEVTKDEYHWISIEAYLDRNGDVHRVDPYLVHEPTWIEDDVNGGRD